MKRILFSELLQQIHSRRRSITLPSESKLANYIRIPGEAKSPFVAPDFEVVDGDDGGTAQALLISAPAAVGKSSLAEEVARRTRNLLWDLSYFSVGSGFFTGTLVDAFGTEGLDAVRQALRAGQATLILDAADEALVRAGSRNFRASLENLASLISDADKTGPSVVILGRPDTIEDTSDYLTSLGVTSQIAKVAFFSEQQAREFVKAKARREKSAGIAEAELDDFLSRFFEMVGGALSAGAWQSNESFLGYAPVLDALGAFYRDESNPMRRLQELNRESSTAHVWDLLIEIVESVLAREAEKFGQSFGGEDSRKRLFAVEAYSRANQLRLLLSDSPEDSEIVPPEGVDYEESWLLEELMPQVRGQYREHPFIKRVGEEPNPLLRFSSVAFRDYAVASLLTAPDRGEAGRMLDYWTDSRVAPSPMLSRFCMSSTLGGRVVATSAVTMIADSHAAGFQSDVTLEIDADAATSPSGGDEVEVLLRENGVEVGAVVARFDEGEPLRLARSVARTTIDAPLRDVVAGAGFPDFAIGPAVSITSSLFDVESPEVRVRSERGRPNEVRTQRIVGSARRVSSPNSEALRIVVPSAVFPWQAYRVQESGHSYDSDVLLYWAGMEMRRNIKWFSRESMMSGGLNYPTEAMEAILGKGRASRRVHEFWLQEGMVVKKKNYWDLSLAGISLPVVQANDTSDLAYRALLLKFLTWCESDGHDVLGIGSD